MSWFVKIKTPGMELIVEKNIILCGGTDEQHQQLTIQIRDSFLKKWPVSRVFTLKEHIRTSEKFLKSVREQFPIKPLLPNQKKEELILDQIEKCYLHWLADFRAALIIIPEMDRLLKREPEYFYQGFIINGLEPVDNHLLEWCIQFQSIRRKPL
jgi:hypothetical protein